MWSLMGKPSSAEQEERRERGDEPVALGEVSGPVEKRHCVII